jgi:hypothetical protein
MTQEITEHEAVYDATGAPTEDLRRAQDATALAAQVTTCLVLHSDATTFTIRVDVDANANPPQILGGQISGMICGGPWVITGGTIGSCLVLNASHQGSGSCASTITIVGSFANPPRWVGTYGFNGDSSAFRHTTVFNGWRPC